jgi:ribosome-associated protein
VADAALGWVLAAARGAASKTDASTVVLDVGDVLALTSWFVVTSASNPRQVKAVAEAVEEAVAAASGPRPRTIEGLGARQWVLVDFGDFVVHVFDDEARAVYDLERLWADVPRVEWAPEARHEDRPDAG